MSVVTAEIYNQFHGELENFIIKKVKDNVIAQDILQDVFVKIHLHLHSIKDQTKLTSWIYQLTRNTIYDYYRKLKVAEEDKEILQEVIELSNHDEEGLVNCILPFINQLPPKYKEALVLTDIKGISQIQMAELLEISYSSAKSRVQRARQKLKILFTDCCVIQSDVYGNILSYSQHECNIECR